jgi:dTDP-4-amino-4,6-dideoxygalactose transaminase
MKTVLTDLAIFGSPPAFPEILHVGRPNIGDRSRLLARINDLLDRRWLTNNGIFVRELESRIAEMLRVKHCLVTCSGTTALEITIRAAGLSGEVIVPSMTFIATAHALQWQGITPVFCDIDAQSHNLDPDRVEELISPRTTGLIGVHLWGRPCAIEPLTNIARRNNLRLLFDAAHAFGCSQQGQMIGNFGLAEVFSFHATKFFHTLEGGAVVTNDDDLAEKIRLMRNFGFVGTDDVASIGINGKMNEASAAMGLTLLESLDELIAVNRQNYHQYQSELKGIPGVRMITYNEAERCNYQYIVLHIDQTVTGISRDQLIEILLAENVLARRYFYPGCHRMEPYRTSFLNAGRLLPATEKTLEGVLVLPTGAVIGSKEVSEISQIIRLVVTRSPEVRNRLKIQTAVHISAAEGAM